MVVLYSLDSVEYFGVGETSMAGEKVTKTVTNYAEMESKARQKRILTAWRTSDHNGRRTVSRVCLGEVRSCKNLDWIY